MRSERFNTAVLDSLPAEIAVLDCAGRIIAINKPWLQFSQNREEVRMDRVGVGVNYLDVCRKAAAEGDEFGDAIPVGQFHVGSRDLLIDRSGRRALDGHAGVMRAFVGQGDAGEEAGLHPGEVLGGFGGIDHQKP